MKFCAIFVTYNPCIDKLIKVFLALLMQDDLYIVVVDNSSSNIDELKSLRDIDKRIKIIEMNNNSGIAKAQNIGINAAISIQSEYVIFFDQDSCVDGSFIADLYADFRKIIDKGLKVAAIGPRFIDEKEHFYFPALRLNKNNLMDKFSVENITEPVEVSFLISSGTLVDVQALHDIGSMREEFFIDFVDTEWCFRAIDKGYKLYISEKAIMTHSIGDDTIRIWHFKIPVHSGFRRYYRIRNLFFMWKLPYIPKELVIKLMISNFFHQILLFTLKDKKIDYIRYYWKAVKDGFKQSRNYNG